MDNTDIAWAAGLFEGEGSFSWHKIKTRKDSLKIAAVLSMTDKDVVEKFCRIVGFGRVKGPYQPQPIGRKERWVWEVQNFSEVLKTIDLFLPFLGERRTEKALEMKKIIIERLA